MGSGRDKRKKAKGSKPGQGAAKTERKTLKNQDKATRRAERATQGGEDDIDALLAKFALEDAGQVQVQHEASPPSARTYATFIPGLGQDASKLYLYGGEWYDGVHDKMYVYSDLYVYQSDKGTWTKITTAKGPQPRSSHQAVIHMGYMYIFGGEFTSPNQEKFKTYGDLWRLDVSSWQWEQLPGRGGPSARCGHRMIAHKDRIYLFGGFYDTGSEQRFYNDLWEFVIADLKWHPLGRPDATRPSPRGGCQLALHGTTLFVIGGYTATLGGGEDEGGDSGKAHNDVWAWDIQEGVWQRVKKVGMCPGPRSSFGMVTHKGRAIMFGGVSDKEGKGDKMYSEMYNELYQFNLDTRRWFPVALRPPKRPTKNTAYTTTDKSNAGAHDEKVDTQQGAAEQALSSTPAAPPPPAAAPAFMQALQHHASDTSSAFYKAAQRIQANFRGFVVRKAYKTYKLGGVVSELLYSPATYGIDLSSRDMPKPRARLAPMMAVVKNTMYMFGGIVEIESTDVPLDDLWSLDLNKLDGWRCIKENSGGEDAFREVDEDASGEDEDEDGET